MEVAILVPRRADQGHRDRLWSYARAAWSEYFTWPIVEGHHDAGPFNRSAAVNRAAAMAGDWDVALIIDADVVPDPAGIMDAVNTAAETGAPASGFKVRHNLDRRGTETILKGYTGNWNRFIKDSHPLCISGALAVRRDLWDKVGGFDELFVGWGFEDTAFSIACETISGHKLFEADCVLWHLWHQRSPEHNHRLPDFQSNRQRREAYTAADGDRRAIGKLLAEAKAARAGEWKAPEASETTIPRILHRTVPAETADEVERWWQLARDLHPRWQYMNHQEPLNPDEWPETGTLWGKCSSGAQKAGLIRLEALWRWGGIYIDSDVELYRSLEPLLGVEAFAGWEDRRCAPDAVLGARPGHPAFAIMLERARALILRGKGAWDSGPGVTTEVLPGRDDVLLLPPGSFYPYHYSTKEADRDRDHRREQPWAFGAHHWHASWVGNERRR